MLCLIKACDVIVLLHVMLLSVSYCLAGMFLSSCYNPKPFSVPKCLLACLLACLLGLDLLAPNWSHEKPAELFFQVTMVQILPQNTQEKRWHGSNITDSDERGLANN